MTTNVNTLTSKNCNFPDMLTLNERTKFARIRAGFSTPQAAAKAIGCSRTTVIRWEDDPAAVSIGSKYLIATANAYKVRPEWLMMELDEDGYPFEGAPSKYRAKIHTGEVRVVDGENDIDERTDVLLDEIDVILSCGVGNTVPEFVETKIRMPFQLSWFRKHGVKPENVKLMRVNGDSMERTIYDGDRVAVHLADKRIRDGKVYAIVIGNDAKLKRLYTLRDGSLRVSSDNTDKENYPDEIIPAREIDTIFIIGRVIDKSGSGGL
ncbi:MAG TPA: S24 family peptidase [Xylella sp.]